MDRGVSYRGTDAGSWNDWREFSGSQWVLLEFILILLRICVGRIGTMLLVSLLIPSLEIHTNVHRFFATYVPRDHVFPASWRKTISGRSVT